MHSDQATCDRPLPAEFPLGIAATFLAMAAVFGASPVSDKLFLVGFCLGCALLAAIVSGLVARCACQKAAEHASTH